MLIAIIKETEIMDRIPPKVPPKSTSPSVKQTKTKTRGSSAEGVNPSASGKRKVSASLESRPILADKNLGGTPEGSYGAFVDEGHVAVQEPPPKGLGAGGKAMAAIRYVLKKLKPDTLLKIAKELITLSKTRSYGERYGEKGLPDKELKHFKHPKLVIVRGMTVNPFYHSVVCFGDPYSPNARFIQHNDTNNYPEFMDRDQFMKYLEAEGGRIEMVWTPPESPKKPYKAHEQSKLDKMMEDERNLTEWGVPNPESLHAHLQDISKTKLRWKGVKDNCYSVCVDIFKSAGCDTSDIEGPLDLPRQNVSSGLKKERKRKERNQAIRASENENSKKDVEISPPIAKRRRRRDAQQGNKPAPKNSG